MPNTYRKFLNTGIDLAPLGVERRVGEFTYFCTPRGASVIGWAGVDGIHFCFIRGFGETVFSVDPSASAPNFVHPVAANFSDFLRLLLACGDAAAPEQAWMWTEERFDLFLKENPPTETQRKILDEISVKMKLSPMDNPFRYIRDLQSSFNYSKIKYTNDFYDPDMNLYAEPAPTPWEVRFDGSFYGRRSREHPGIEIPLGARFEWAGRRWLIPAAYSCSRGLVVDFCMMAEAEEVAAFLDKWLPKIECSGQLSHEQQMKLDLDNPLQLEFSPHIDLNGRRLRRSGGRSLTYTPPLPLFPETDREAAQVVEHYGLDAGRGWLISRYSFPWGRSRRPEVKSLAVTMEQRPEPIPGPHFTIHAPGDTFTFISPVNGETHTLTAHEFGRQTLPENSFGNDSREYPTHYFAMSYTVDPNIPTENLQIADCEESDRPREVAPPEYSYTPTASNDLAVIGIIGGADGPTAIFIGPNADTHSTPRMRAACSSLHFDPPYRVEWRLIFREKRFDDMTFKLM